MYLDASGVVWWREAILLERASLPSLAQKFVTRSVSWLVIYLSPDSNPSGILAAHLCAGARDRNLTLYFILIYVSYYLLIPNWFMSVINDHFISFNLMCCILPNSFLWLHNFQEKNNWYCHMYVIPFLLALWAYKYNRQGVVGACKSPTPPESTLKISY